MSWLGANDGLCSGPTVSAPRTSKLTLTVQEAAELIGISRAQAYRCVRSGQLKAVQLGRRIVVPIIAVEELLSMTVAPDGPRAASGE